MVRRGRSLGGRRHLRGWTIRALALSGALSVAVAALSLPGHARASGTGTLTFTPRSGPVSTPVTVTISAVLPSPTPYLLSVSPTDPASNACADGLRLADAPKIIVVPGQPTTTTFFWPTELSAGAYYLCASPGGGVTGPIVWSQQPFTVTSGTPTGSSSIPAGSAVVAQAPSGGVIPGDTITVTVDTVAFGGDTPQDFSLTRPGQPGAVPVNWVSEAQNGTVYTYVVSIPLDTPPGAYAVRATTADGSIAAISNTFQVVAESARGGPGGPQLSSPRPTSVPGSSATSPAIALLVAIISLLLSLAVASLAAPLLRRRHHDAPLR